MRLCLLLTLLALTAAVLRILLADRGPEAEGVEGPSYVRQDFIPGNEWSRPGTELEKIDGVVIHYVGNPGTTAGANRNYFASLSSGAEGTYASSHFVVGLEGEVLQCIPLTEIAYASKDRNGDTVAIEVCHPDETGEFSASTNCNFAYIGGKPHGLGELPVEYRRSICGTGGERGITPRAFAYRFRSGKLPQKLSGQIWKLLKQNARINRLINRKQASRIATMLCERRDYPYGEQAHK